MDKKVKKLYEVATKHFPGPDDNPSLRYKRMEVVKDILTALGMDSSKAKAKFNDKRQ